VVYRRVLKLSYKSAVCVSYYLGVDFHRLFIRVAIDAAGMSNEIFTLSLPVCSEVYLILRLDMMPGNPILAITNF
jgi:hypothetical protein